MTKDEMKKYIFDEDEDSEYDAYPDYVHFFIGRNGETECVSLGDEVTMPPGFHESMESHYEFHGTKEEAEALLKQYGFTNM